MHVSASVAHRTCRHCLFCLTYSPRTAKCLLHRYNRIVRHRRWCVRPGRRCHVTKTQSHRTQCGTRRRVRRKRRGAARQRKHCASCERHAPRFPRNADRFVRQTYWGDVAVRGFTRRRPPLRRASFLLPRPTIEFLRPPMQSCRARCRTIRPRCSIRGRHHRDGLTRDQLSRGIRETPRHPSMSERADRRFYVTAACVTNDSSTSRRADSDR